MGSIAVYAGLARPASGGAGLSRSNTTLVEPLGIALDAARASTWWSHRARVMLAAGASGNVAPNAITAALPCRRRQRHRDGQQPVLPTLTRPELPPIATQPRPRPSAHCPIQSWWRDLYDHRRWLTKGLVANFVATATRPSNAQSAVCASTSFGRNQAAPLIEVANCDSKAIRRGSRCALNATNRFGDRSGARPEPAGLRRLRPVGGRQGLFLAGAPVLQPPQRSHSGASQVRSLNFQPCGVLTNWSR